jgi:hypothetical protein
MKRNKKLRKLREKYKKKTEAKIKEVAEAIRKARAVDDVLEGLKDEKKKIFYFSIDFEQAGFEAETAEEAMDMAEQAIKEGRYQIQLIESEDL